MFARRISRALSSHHSALFRRLLSTVEGNPHIVSKPPSLLTPIDSSQFAFPDKRSLNGHILSLLPTDPPTLEIAIGTTSKFPPTPDSLTENPKFHTILQSVVAEYATEDPEVISKAAAMASESGANLFGHGRRSSARRQSGDAGGGASAQGGAGSGGRGGWIHVSDQRNPPDWGRVAWPEDIFGSLEVDGQGQFVDPKGNYQPSGTYRIITREGILGLSPFLREKLLQRLRQEEANLR